MMDIPDTKYAVQYLLQRGIKLETALGAARMQIMVPGSHPRGVYRERLGFDIWWNGKSLPDIVEEGIWFPCIDAKGDVQSYFFRPLPELTGKDGNSVKFLTPKDGIGYPFVLSSVWDVASKPNHPLCLTEGAV